MTEERLTEEERAIMLKVARQTLENRLRDGAPTEFSPGEYPGRFLQPGATFVTLTMDGKLRGCIGTLEITKPLVEDVQEHVLAAAFQDYRFQPVAVEDLEKIKIEISQLTPSREISYERPDELPQRLRPFVDGVTVKYGDKRATFLPQVWNKIPDPEKFLDQLCLKMGVDPRLWRHKKLQVLTYQVDSFSE